MGLCFSKKKRTPPPPISPSSNSIAVEKKIGEKKKKKKKQQQQQQQEIEPTTIPSSKSLSGKAAATVAAAAAAAAATEKKPPVFVIMQNAAKNSAGEKEKKDRPEIESNGGGGIISATAAVDEARPVPVRTSSCTKEEVDAILIQCGRLSRSSSGKAPSSDTTGGGGHRRFSGSKRSFDFDHEKKLGEEELETAGESEKQLSRPSPRRRTPGRDRSGSRERATGASGGSRRVSRSPSRRSDGPASSSASAGERTKQPPLQQQQQQQQQQQPAKMVSVPAREKEAGVKRASPVKPKRCASPRSQSPANSARIGNENAGLNRAPQPGQPQSLSRSSSRKAENSPYRRNPMAEIDDNSLTGPNHIGGANNYYKVSKSPQKVDDGVRKLNQTQSQKSSENNVAPRKSETLEEALEAKGSSNSTPNVIFETLNPRAVTQSRSSRRSSRDLDQNLGYTSLLLEDIQNYYHHQHNNTTAFSLPACVSKACSILEAVADLNSSSSENDKGSSLNGRFGKRGGSVPREPIFESEILVKDDLMEPTLHKYVSVRDLGGGGGVGVGGGEMEPQESAGSNSFLGQPWAASSWEPNSVDSTDQYSASQSINGEEEVEQQNGVNAAGRRSRGGSTGSNIVVAVNTSRKKREIGGDHQQQQQQQQRRLYRGGSSVSARSGTRALSVPVTAAAAQSSS